MIKNHSYKNNVKKYIDTAIVLTPTTTAGVTALNIPSQGSGSNDRVGDKIVIDCFEMSLIYQGNGTNTHIMRFSLLQQAGYYPSITPLQIYSDGPSGSIDIDSLFIPFYQYGFFKVVTDDIQPVVAGANSFIHVKKTCLRPKYQDLIFSPGTNNVVMGRPLIASLSDSVSAGPSILVNIRCWFYDA
jgi:hypothetical protein